MTILAELLSDRRCIVLDGGLATELHHAGIAMGDPLWSAQALLSAEGRAATQRAQAGFAAAGADVITANTFRTNLRAVRAIGAGAEECAHLTRTAVRLANAASRMSTPERGRPVVAASIAPLAECYDPSAVPGDRALEMEHGFFAALLARLGVKVALIETMNCVREAEIATRAARRHRIEPWVSFVCGPNGELLSGEPLRDAARAVVEAGAQAVLLNCCELGLIRDALSELDDLGVPVGIYPNVEDRSHADTCCGPLPAALDPRQFAAAVTELVAEHGLSLAGGCCGARPSHIGALAASLQLINQGVLA